MAAEWYYVTNGESSGPIDLDNFLQKLRSGQISRDVLAWTHGMTGWMAASSIGELAVFPPPPPRPPVMPVYAARPQFLPYAAAPPRGFLEACKVCLNKYASFGGRASRSEYWYFVLFQTLLGMVASAFDAAGQTEGAFGAVVTLGLLLPGFAVHWRRLHDTGRSGWWIGASWLGAIGGCFLGGLAMGMGNEDLGGGIMVVSLLAAGVAQIIVFVFTCQKGTDGPNQFGQGQTA